MGNLDYSNIKDVSREPGEKFLKELLDFRNKFLFHKDHENYLGRLVWDIKNKEYGFIVGPFERQNETSDRVLLITRWKAEDGEGFRVRYTRPRDLRYLKDDLARISTAQQDLTAFCNEQCIMECSEQCALFKYKNKI